MVAHYLQSLQGSGASRSALADRAHGDDLVQLLGVRVLQGDGVAAAVDVRKPVGIELDFRVLGPGVPVFPKIKVYDQHGDVAFNAMDTSARWQEPAHPGSYTATAWIPADLLNEGLVTVDVAVCSLGMHKLHPHAGMANAVSFHVHDPGDGSSARGLFTGQWRGVVRPLLEWTTEEH